MILITLCIFLLCTVGISAKGGEVREVYVRTGASGNGTALSPVGTLTDAVNLLNGEGGRIVLLSEVTVSSATTLKEQSGDLTITASGGSLVLANDLTFAKNVNNNTIIIDCPIKVSAKSAAIFGGFNSVVFTENVAVSGKLDFYGGNDAPLNEIKGVSSESIPKNEAVITELPYSITVNGGKFTCIDLYALSLSEALDGTLLSSDNLHPDASGYTVYMHKVADAILDGKCTVENFEMTDLYVSASGTNNAECTKENPTNNLSIAFAKAAPTATVHIVDSYTLSLHGEQYCIVLPAIDSLTIVGENVGATITTNCKYLLAQSDVTLDNLTLTTTASGAFMLQMGYNNATLTETFSIPTKHLPMFAAGFVSFAGSEGTTYYNSVESISSDNDCIINLLGGTYYYFLGGNYSYETTSPIGTYSGNMTLNIGKDVILPYAKYSSVVSGICGINYLTGSITASVASWPDADVLTYANRGTTCAENYNPSKNTGTVTVNLAEGMNNGIVVMGDFNGSGKIEVTDVLYMVKALVNKNMSKPEQYYAKTTITLLDVVSLMKQLIK